MLLFRRHLTTISSSICIARNVSSSAVKHGQFYPNQKDALFLGLDVSTRSTGYGLINAEGKVLDLGAWDLSDSEDLIESGSRIRSHLQAMVSSHPEHTLWVSGIEAFALNFSANRTSLQTLFKLAGLNSIVQYECAQVLGRSSAVSSLHLPFASPYYATAPKWQSYFGIRNTQNRKKNMQCIDESDDLEEGNSGAYSRNFQLPLPDSSLHDDPEDVKAFGFELVRPLLPSSFSVRVKKTGRIHSSMYDATDAVLIAFHTMAQRGASLRCASLEKEMKQSFPVNYYDSSQDARDFDLFCQKLEKSQRWMKSTKQTFEEECPLPSTFSKKKKKSVNEEELSGDLLEENGEEVPKKKEKKPKKTKIITEEENEAERQQALQARETQWQDFLMQKQLESFSKQIQEQSRVEFLQEFWNLRKE